MASNNSRFMTFLGTGNYYISAYEFAGKKSKPVTFVQSALCEVLNIGKATIFCTDQAYLKHSEQLLNEMNGIVSDAEVKFVRIPEGKLIDQLWEIFEIIYEELEPNEHIILDITHGFRYQPMLAGMLLQYANVLKNIHIDGIFYGAWEARTELDDMPISPIFDLTTFFNIQQWALAANEFKMFGNAERFSRLVNQQLGLLKKGEKTDLLRQLSPIVNRVVNLSKDIRTLRGKSIKEGHNLGKLKESISNIDASALPPIRHIIQSVESVIDDFNSDEVGLRLIAAAKWCYDRNMVQESYTYLVEGIMTHVMICASFDEDLMFDNLTRNAVGHVINNALRVGVAESISGADGVEGVLLEKKLMPVSELILTLSPIFSALKDLRNDVNHAGMRESKRTADSIVNNLGSLLDEVNNALSTTVPKEVPTRRDTKFFFNISNHPSSEWEDEQLGEASVVAPMLIDVPFPDVDPAATENEMMAMCSQVVDFVESVTRGDPEGTSIHVMGEMRLTYLLITTFQRKGYRCLASTSVRDVAVTEEGDIVKRFRFDSFREYPSIIDII